MGGGLLVGWSLDIARKTRGVIYVGGRGLQVMIHRLTVGCQLVVGLLAKPTSQRHTA